MSAITGNHVELVEVPRLEVARKLRGRSELWRDIRGDGVVVFGLDLEALTVTQPAS